MSHVEGLLVGEQSISLPPERVRRNRRRRRRRARGRTDRAVDASVLVASAERARVSGILEDAALDEHVHAAHLELAGAINNDGLAEQIAFLIAQHGRARVTDILAKLGVPISVEDARPATRHRRESARRARVLTRRQLRRAEENGTRATEWVRQNGRTYANLVDADGRPRTVQVISPRRRSKDGRR